jgi:hypothetical protein
MEKQLQHFADDLLEMLDRSSALSFPVDANNRGLLESDREKTCNWTMPFLLNMIDAVIAIQFGGNEVPRADFWFYLMFSNDAWDIEHVNGNRIWAAIDGRGSDVEIVLGCQELTCVAHFLSDYCEALTGSRVKSFYKYNGSSTCLALFILKSLFFPDLTEQTILEHILNSSFFDISRESIDKFEECLKVVLRDVSLITTGISLLVDPKTKETIGFDFNYGDKLLRELVKLNIIPTKGQTFRPPTINPPRFRKQATEIYEKGERGGQMYDIPAKIDPELHKAIGENTKKTLIKMLNEDSQLEKQEMNTYFNQKWYFNYNL